LQPSTSVQYDGAPLAAFGAGGYRMHRPSSGVTAAERDRYHHRSSFFQRQGSASMQPGTRNGPSSSWVETNRQMPRGSRVAAHHQYGNRSRPNHRQQDIASIGGIGGIGREFQLPFLLSTTTSTTTSGEGTNNGIYPSSGCSPVRVQTALPTFSGGITQKNEDDMMMSSFIYPAQLPSLRSSEFLATAGLIAGTGGSTRTTRSAVTSHMVTQSVSKQRQLQQQEGRSWGKDPSIQRSYHSGMKR